MRRTVRAHAHEAGLGENQIGELLVAASEAVTNSLLNARATGAADAVAHAQDLVCDVTDGGDYTDRSPAGAPVLEASGGRGLGIMNQRAT